MIKIEKFKKGDYCFIIDSDNKIKFCIVKKEILGEPCDGFVYQVQDTIDWRFRTIRHEMCAESEEDAKKILKSLKGRK